MKQKKNQNRTLETKLKNIKKHTKPSQSIKSLFIRLDCKT